MKCKLNLSSKLENKTSGRCWGESTQLMTTRANNEKSESIQEVTDPTVEKVFKEKLYAQPYHEAFVSEEEGMAKIRKGLYAFHALFAAHKIISDAFEEHEKCRVKQIPMFLANHIGFPIRKGSPYS
ncbi:hypothetical protein C0J52_21748 [Blattella germanica]|nr:hypothetical protein C0J52_21748 [Blattella germanica]